MELRVSPRLSAPLVILVMLTALIPASDSASAREGFFDRITSGFGPNRAGEPPADAVRYATTFEVPGASRALRRSIEAASNLDALQSAPPSGAAGVARRAFVDYERLTAALYANGYYAGEITITVAGEPPESEAALGAIEKARRTGLVPVRVTVVPGPIFHFGPIHILDVGSHAPLPDMPSPSELGLVEGEVAKANAITGAEGVITRTLRNRGHPLATIAEKEVVADHATRTLDVTLLVDPGPTATFGPISVSGNTRTKTSFIENRISIRTGEPYSAERLEKLRKDLAKYEAFAGVRIKEADALDANGQLPVTIEVIERKPRYVGIGAKYSTSEGTTLNAFWGHRNLFGGGETLRLDAQVSWYGETPDALPDAAPFGYKVSATFTKPDFITTQDELIAQAAVLREITDAYARDAVTFLGGIRHRFNDRLSVQPGIDLELANVETPQTGWRKDFIVGLPVDIAYDSTDDPLDPSEGLRASATFEPFAHLGDAGAGPLLAKGSIATYRALDEDDRLILAGRVSAGSLFGADLFDIPPQRRFYVGGGGTLRGYNYQSASPRDAKGDIIGGRSFFLASIEARFKVTDTVGLVPFVDMGAAFRSEAPHLDRLRYAAGLGLRYYTGIGPIRFDVALPLNPRKGDGEYGIYLGLGQAF